MLAAIVSFGLALTAVEVGAKSVGVIAPYIAQVRLIRSMIQDFQSRRTTRMVSLSEVACSTVHQFQGSERDVIVLDTVESYPAKRPGILTYNNANGSVDRLVNVAVTRARGKLLTVANESFWNPSITGKDNAFGLLCRHHRLFDTALTARSGRLEQALRDLDYGPNMQLFDMEEAKKGLLEDLNEASQRIVFSFPDGKLDEPFATELYKVIRRLRLRGIEILAKCCDYDELSEDWKTFTWQSDDAIFPLVVIDGAVCWYGMPPARWKPPARGGIAPSTTLATPVRISGHQTISMIWSLANMDTRVADRAPWYQGPERQRKGFLWSIWLHKGEEALRAVQGADDAGAGL